MDFKGFIIKVFPIKSGVSKTSGKEWASQDYLIEEFKQQYCQSIVFNVFGQDRIDKFQLKEGQMVTVSLDFKANEWQEKFYNRVTCYNVIHESATTAQPTQPAPASSQPTPQQAAPQQTVPQQQGQSDDLPFN
jgi:hypothetical protein|nr:MAG TPA: protein of unknown function (DUF3127) [Caudoviricetes sp.]